MLLFPNLFNDIYMKNYEKKFLEAIHWIHDPIETKILFYDQCHPNIAISIHEKLMNSCQI